MRVGPLTLRLTTWLGLLPGVTVLTPTVARYVIAQIAAALNGCTLDHD